MTRLTEDDVRTLGERLEAFEDDLRAVSGLGLREVAGASVATPPACVPLIGAAIAAVPVTSGQGVISGFSECVCTILRHLGCEAWVTVQADVGGLQEAVSGGAEVVFLADDYRFVAFSLTKARCIDNDSATADGYVTALEAAAGSLLDRRVLLLGLGPIGRAAARRMVSRGAQVQVVETDQERLQAALDIGLKLEPVSLAEGLSGCDLIYDATPASDLIDAGDLRPDVIAAVPGLPSGFTSEARAALGPRHIHEPLAIGVAVMAGRALV
jgi:pyrrolysine biosynthesis protein PylD